MKFWAISLCFTFYWFIHILFYSPLNPSSTTLNMISKSMKLKKLNKIEKFLLAFVVAWIFQKQFIFFIFKITNQSKIYCKLVELLLDFICNGEGKREVERDRKLFSFPALNKFHNFLKLLSFFCISCWFKKCTLIRVSSACSYQMVTQTKMWAFTCPLSCKIIWISCSSFMMLEQSFWHI